LFVIIKKNPPRCVAPENVPSSSRNIIVQTEEDGHMDIEDHHDQVNSIWKKMTPIILLSQMMGQID
jgi:hypothetical protein